jgi:hypothetical protein
VGAARSGTTSLYEYLGRVPRVFIAPVKEPHYFAPSVSENNAISRFVTHDRKQYLELFKNVKNEDAIGEASASYLWDIQSPKAIHDAVPDARIIMILRDPIERAFSHYLMSVRQKEETLPFYDAIEKDYKSSEKGYFISHLYVELGLYAEQIGRYIETFGFKNIKVLIFEDFIKEPQTAVNDVLEFLGLEPYRPANIGKVYDPYLNSTNRRRSISLLSRFVFRSKTADKANEIFKTATTMTSKNSQTDKDSRAQQILRTTYASAVPEDGKRYLKEVYHKDVTNVISILGKSVPWPNFI